jgi:prephenate dehydrogenase
MKVAVVGLGLIGGSVARGLTRAGHHVVGVDVAAVARRARRAHAVGSTFSRVEGLAGECDIVVLAAPPEANLRLLRRVAATALPGLVVTDVGSVKGPICREAARLGLDGFVGGHPMAGSERSGFAASSANLFRGRHWILTPAPRRASAMVKALARSLGARTVVMDPREHDRLMAFVSHVPQLVAWALHSVARADPVAGRRLGLAGQGYRDMTRLARSPRGVWREILRGNRREVGRALAALRRSLEQEQGEGS